MTTNTTRNKSQTREPHDSPAARRGERPSGAGDASRSADEIRETVKGAVGKGVAAVAGAVEGIDETLQDTQLADTAESAIRQVGGMGTRVVKAAKEEGANLKEAFMGEAGEANPTEAQGGFGSSSLGDEDEDTSPGL